MVFLGISIHFVVEYCTSLMPETMKTMLKAAVEKYQKRESITDGEITVSENDHWGGLKYPLSDESSRFPASISKDFLDFRFELFQFRFIFLINFVIQKEKNDILIRGRDQIL